MDDLSNYRAKSGNLVAVWTLEIQTLPADVDRILDAVMEVHPLEYGNYQRNASVSAVGWETSQPKEGSTTTTHLKGFKAGGTESYPIVELKISVPRDVQVLERVMDAVLYVHQYEEPVIYVREDWASHSAYNPKNDNPNRWWNNGRGLPKKI
ncbi:hypothetical protein [uncultured Sulfitobacter sp.]|uniref:hypothetical protein n=1 Tax=uncultured Sulfitobacter sp. TaxID=191468 RepID=UPI0026079129|nr:hypothetical protein [uncultured Sulfitobacter sp.]